MDQSIFITQDSNILQQNNKVTFTNIMDIIPDTSTQQPMIDWEKLNKIEWRWRFLKFDDKHVVEISYKLPDLTKRMYFNKNEEWVIREVPSDYDIYVYDQYFYYTDHIENNEKMEESNDENKDTYCIIL